MKHKLLLALAGAAMMSMSAMAVELTDPVAPTKPTRAAYNGTWVAPQAGTTYYIYNVGASQFLGAGRDWNTRTITTCDSVVLLNQAAVAVGSPKYNYVLPFTLEDAGTDDGGEVNLFWLHTLNTNKNFETYVFVGGNDSWVDGNGSGSGVKWQVVPSGDSYLFHPVTDGYLYAPLSESENVGEYRVLGVDAVEDPASYTWSDAWAGANEEGKTYKVEWKFIEASDEVGEAIKAYIAESQVALDAAMETYNAELLVYNARVALKTAIQEADELGIDVAAAVAVYNNNASTAADLQDQNTHLRAAVASLSYDFSGASESNPLDVTDQVLKNPTFDTDITGWTITVGGQNLQWQDRQDGIVDADKNWVQINKFIEAWIPSTLHLGDGTISQTVYGLPKGKYILECDAMATLQGGSPNSEDAVEGAFIFIQGDESEVLAPIKSPDTQPKHWSVVFLSEGDDALTFGLKVVKTTANWISADNFKLTYYGETNKSQAELSLEAAIAEAQEISENLSSNDIESDYVVNVEATVASSFTQALTSAQSALEGSDEEMTAAEAELKAAIDEVNKSSSLYKKFQEVYNNALNTAQKFKDNNNQWPELQNQINDYAEVELTEAFKAGTLTEDDLEGAQGKVAALVTAFINDPSKIQVGDDLTVLLVNPGFDTNLNGWTVKSGATPAISSGLAEVYCAQFDIHQVIPNLPAGVYEVSLQGFTRNQPGGSRMAFTEEDQEGTTFAIYTPISEAKIQNILAGASTELIAQRGDETEPENYIMKDDGVEYDIAADIDGIVYYMPNGMPSARLHFDRGDYKTTLRVIHSEAGDLDLGIRCTSSQEWCLWDELELRYMGQDLSVYYELISKKGEELTLTHDDSYTTTHAEALYSELEGKVENADNITTVEDAMTLLAELNDAIDYIKAGNVLVNEALDLATLYGTFAEEQNVSDPDFQTVLDKIYDYENETPEDNDAITKDIEDLKKYWIAAVVNNAEELDELPGIILNADFETGNIQYWTDTFPEGNHGFQNNNTYSDADGNVVIQNFAEAWNKNITLAAGEISQEIAAPLPEGYYQLEIDGYAVNQAGEPEEGVQGVYLFVKTGNTVVGKQNIGISGNSGVSQHWTLGFYSNGVSKTTVGVLVDGEEVNCNWTAFDNFKLIYYGQTIPDAVEGIAAKSAAPKAIYTLDGRQTTTLNRGINIVRKADGSVQKVFVK